MTKFTSLQDITNKLKYTFDTKHNNYESDIVNIFNGNDEDYTKYENNDLMLNIIGLYNQYKQNYETMIKYYLMAIEMNNTTAMNNLARYYTTKNDGDNMIKYYLMSIERNNTTAMNNLANYYDTKKDYDNMKKYYLMSIEMNNTIAMNNLACYYMKINDYGNMIKYYLMSIERNNTTAMNNLAYYYDTINDYDNMKKYYLMSIEMNNTTAMNELARYYQKINDYDNMMKYYTMAVEKDDVLMVKNVIKTLIKRKDHSELKKWIILNLPRYDYKNMDLYTIDNKLVMFDIYLELYAQNRNINIRKQLKKLYFDHNVLQYIFKFKINCLDGECHMCLKETKLLTQCCVCTSKVCNTCYVNINKCPECKNTDEYLNTPFNYINVTLSEIKI